jgi:hypothetical protein
LLRAQCRVAIAAALRALPVRSATLDGEGVICGPDGVSDFDRLRVVFSRKGSPDVFLYAFDVLELDGRDLRVQRWDVEDTDGAVVFRQFSPSDAIAAIARGAAANGSRSRTAHIPPSSARCSSP